MKIHFKIIFYSLIILLLIFLGYVYYTLEELSNNDFGCGCSSACVSFQPKVISKIFGYFLIFTSLMFTIFSILKLKNFKKLFAIPSVIIFVIANYGNGHYIFNKGACGESLNEANFFINHKKIGDFAKDYAETLNLDSLNIGKYNGKLLGYSSQKNGIKVFRINDEPIIIKTKFLFWEIRDNVILNNISYGLDSYRNFEVEKMRGNYEFIGGKGMTENDFLNEFVLTNKELIGIELKNKKITQEKNGTTRFTFNIQ